MSAVEKPQIPALLPETSPPRFWLRSAPPLAQCLSCLCPGCLEISCPLAPALARYGRFFVFFCFWKYKGTKGDWRVHVAPQAPSPSPLLIPLADHLNSCCACASSSLLRHTPAQKEQSLRSLAPIFLAPAAPVPMAPPRSHGSHRPLSSPRPLRCVQPRPLRLSYLRSPPLLRPSRSVAASHSASP